MFPKQQSKIAASRCPEPRNHLGAAVPPPELCLRGIISGRWQIIILAPAGHVCGVLPEEDFDRERVRERRVNGERGDLVPQLGFDILERFRPGKNTNLPPPYILELQPVDGSVRVVTVPRRRDNDHLQSDPSLTHARSVLSDSPGGQLPTRNGGPVRPLTTKRTSPRAAPLRRE